MSKFNFKRSGSVSDMFAALGLDDDDNVDHNEDGDEDPFAAGVAAKASSSPSLTGLGDEYTTSPDSNDQDDEAATTPWVRLVDADGNTYYFNERTESYVRSAVVRSIGAAVVGAHVRCPQVCDRRR